MDNVLCGANAQSMRYYFNEDDFGILPEQIKKELKIICVTYCADVGGAVTLSFDDAHHLHFQTIDPIDEIGSELKIRKLQNDYRELFEQLEEFSRTFCK
ncbi:MAG: hypothetical protein IJU30_02030 [Lachnospiraceae bacterium]|nr:hypothetical protein [Lachnospiraceae bacterium]